MAYVISKVQELGYCAVLQLVPGGPSKEDFTVNGVAHRNRIQSLAISQETEASWKNGVDLGRCVVCQLKRYVGKEWASRYNRPDLQERSESPGMDWRTVPGLRPGTYSICQTRASRIGSREKTLRNNGRPSSILPDDDIGQGPGLSRNCLLFRPIEPLFTVALLRPLSNF